MILRMPRHLFACAVALGLPSALFAQSYTIDTFAGGGLPVNIPGTSATNIYSYGVAADPNGNLYFSTDKHTVLRLDAQTGVLTLAAGSGIPGFSGDGGPAAAAQLNTPTGVAVDSAGNLYIGDTLNFRVRKVSNGVITTIAGNGTSAFGGDNGPAIGAQLSAPHGVTVDAAGNLYIADWGQRVRKVSNGIITTIAGNGTQGFSGDGGPATSAELNYPNAIAIDSAGNLYIADESNNRIRRVTNGIITTVAGTGTAGFDGDNIPAAGAELRAPLSVAVDSAGNLYIADTGNSRLREVSGGVIRTVVNGLQPLAVAVGISGNLYFSDFYQFSVHRVSAGVVSTIAGGGSFVGDGGPAASGQLYLPYGVAVDSAGDLYIADTDNNRIRKVSAGVISTVAGNGVRGYGGDSGPAINAELDYPEGLVVDPSGNLYFTDSENNCVRKVSGGVITTVVGNGSVGFSGDNGPAASAELNTPFGLALDSAGDLYIADFLNYRVRKVSNGVITTVAGNGTQGYSGDGGPATSAQLGGPEGIAVDAAGNLYFTDEGHVRKVSNGVISTVASLNAIAVAVDPAGDLYVAEPLDLIRISNGVMATIAGAGQLGYNGDNIPAITAQVNFPFGLALDTAGNIYLADTYNNRIRILNPANFTLTPASANAGPGVTAGTVAVAGQPGAAWTASSNNSWLTVTAGSGAR